jgi:hypothetical protein
LIGYVGFILSDLIGINLDGLLDELSQFENRLNTIKINIFDFIQTSLNPKDVTKKT